MLLTQSLRRMRQLAGNSIATVDGAERRTWAETNDRVARLAGGLTGLGVTETDRVAILALNSFRYLEVYYAILWMGAVAVPLNTRWSVDELGYGLSDSASDVLFIDAHFLPYLATLRERWPRLRHVVFMGDTARPDLIAYESLVAGNAPLPAADLAPTALAIICYTGGTTGRSKGVMQSHLSVWASSVAFGVDCAGLMNEQPVFLHAMPLFHTGGAALMFATSIAGGTHVFLPGFDAEAVLRLIQDQRITHTALVPTMVRMLLDQPALASCDLSSLRTLVYGAAPMTTTQIEETMAKLPHVSLQQGYGQTELSPYISMLRAKDHVTVGDRARRLGSAGYAGLCSEIIIADSAGKELPRGEVGEVLVRGPHVMSGYWRKPEETKATILNGWVRTGDAGYMDDAGYIFLVDRVKDMIVSGGENVYSSEVEDVVARHPAVAANVVIGIPSEKWGEAVHAIVVLRPGQSATAEEVIEHCRKSIAGYKCPRSVEFRSEPLPLSGVGKVLKRELRKPYWEGRASRLV